MSRTRMAGVALILALLALLLGLPAGQQARAGSTLTSRSGSGKASALLARQWRILQRDPVRIAIRRSGWYQIEFARLRQLGMPASLDPRRLHLYTGAREVPVSLSGHATDLAGAGSVSFYAVGANTPTTGTRIYWLASGASPSRRIPVESAAAVLSTARSSYFLARAEDRPRSVYFPLLLNGSASNFFGPIVDQQPVSLTLTTPSIADSSAQPATLEIALQGVSLTSHSVAISVDGSPLGPMSFQNRDHAAQQWRVPLAGLRSGANTVTIAPSGADGDLSLVDTVSLIYPRLFQASQDELAFTGSHGQVITLRGFTTSRVRLLDVTNPLAVRRVAFRASQLTNSHAVSFRVPATGPSLHRFIAQPAASSLSPVSLSRRAAPHWYASSNGADLVIIGYHSFLPALAPLVRLRQRQGLSVAEIDVRDLYDEFAFGAHGPSAIRQFITWARGHWRHPPRYVLLAGGASYDPRDYLGKGDLDFVPTRLIDAGTMETASDEWLVDPGGDGVPDAAIGRLPARSLAEMRAMVSKIAGYSWSRQSRAALVVADSPRSSVDYDFPAAASLLRGSLPSSITTTTIDATGTSAAELRRRILAGIGTGPLLVDYAGHGNVDRWSSADFFDNSDAATLTNGPRLPIFIMMTCLNGYFISPTLESLAQKLLVNPQGGAVAVWASTGETVPQPQIDLNAAFFRQLFARHRSTIGDVILRASPAANDEVVRRTWVLLGDPSMPVG